jgi:DNA-binding MarR family transcriptional regulator
MNRRSVRDPSREPAFHFDDSESLPEALTPEQRQILREEAIREQRQRELRRKLFEPNMFGEPAWEILLALYVTDSVERRLSIAQLTTVTHVPLTTALRWLAHLEDQEFVSRSIAPSDQRIVLIELTDFGRRSMEVYLCRIRNDALLAKPRDAG